MLYLALDRTPRMVPTGEVTRKAGEESRWHRITGWKELGIVEAANEHDALQEAKRRYGGSPVIADLEGSVH